MPLCRGCGRSFKSTGYLSHLTQSTNPSCQAILSQQFITTGSDSESEDSVSDDDVSDHLLEVEIHGSVDDLGNDVGIEENNVHEEDEEASDAERRRLDYSLEDSWEQTRPLPNELGGQDMDMDDDDDLQASNVNDFSHFAETSFNLTTNRIQRYSSQHPESHAGVVLKHVQTTDDRYSSSLGSNVNPWAPFTSEMDWKIAQWAKLRGPGSTAFSELLAIKGVREALNLSYKNSEELNKLVDGLPSRPLFRRHEVVVAGESFEFYARDIVDCIKALWGDPDFLPFLVFEPERHYFDEDRTIRLFHDMQTGKWWWATQQEVERETKKTKITIIPIVISSDKTQLTTFGNKTAYPVYLTIGNLPKHIRRKPGRQGQLLLAYLPTSKLEHISNKSARRRAVANLFHACMSFILKPVETLGRTGIQMTSGDGAVRDCHPIFAIFSGDYPEQVLATCTKTGECPTCPVPRDELGDPAAVEDPREIGPILEALATINNGSAAFSRACKDARIKPIQYPFWQGLPFLNIFRSIAPDILHQMYQGNIKHMISWIREACGDAEIDARCRRLPPNHNIRLFLKGISHLSRVTGKEHDQICRFLLGLVIDIPILGHSGRGARARLVRAVRALLDFLYLAKYPVHSDESLREMQRALQMYQESRQIFLDLGIRTDFNFPKDHFLNHYHELIEFFGTTDNYNTEYTERLHIDFAKEAYRATNFKQEYPQMTAWLDRREKVNLHHKFITRRFQPQPLFLPPRIPLLIHPRQIKIAATPSLYGVSLDVIETQYGAKDFKGALTRFVLHRQHPDFSRRQVESAAHGFYIPCDKISVFHRIKFTSNDPFSVDPTKEVVVDSIHCEPVRTDKSGKDIPGRFDTAMIQIESGGHVGIKGVLVFSPLLHAFVSN